MSRFFTLAVLALLTVAEIAAVLAIVDAFGPGGAVLILGMDVVVGMIVLRWAALSPVEVRGWRLAAGAFIALPGLVLDLVGLALLVPVVQRRLGATMRRNTEFALRRRGMSVVTVTDSDGNLRTAVVPGDVVTGEVIPDDAPGEGPGYVPERAPGNEARDARDQPPAPPIIRGELEG